MSTCTVTNTDTNYTAEISECTIVIGHDDYRQEQTLNLIHNGVVIICVLMVVLAFSQIITWAEIRYGGDQNG